MASSNQPRGKAGQYISKEEAKNVTEKDLPKLVHKSSKMTGALKDLKEAKEDRELDKPLISLSLNNPIAWFMKWLNKLKKKQTTTITFRLGVPLIALPVLVIALATVFYSLGKLTQESEIQETPTATSYPLSKVGLLKIISEGDEMKYFLILSTGEVIDLSITEGIDLSLLDGKRILATGSYECEDKILVVQNVADLEVLPDSPEPIPDEVIITPLPSPTVLPTMTPSMDKVPTATPASVPGL